MSKEELRRAIFNTIEYLNNYEMSPTAKKLVIHYFNDSKKSTSYERAIEAMVKYTPEGFNEDNKKSEQLNKKLSYLKRIADAWDRE